MVDSASVVNGIQTAGQIAQAVTQITGQQQYGSLISLILSAVVPIASFIFGHVHGKKTK